MIQESSSHPTHRWRKTDSNHRSLSRNALLFSGGIARLIPDHATIELGLGAIPQAVTNALGRKQGLGVHSGAIGDGIADLMEAGIVENRHKA